MGDGGRVRKAFWIAVIVCWCQVWIPMAGALQAETPEFREVRTDESERQLIRGLEAIRDLRAGDALREFKLLTTEKPDFRLAQLIYGDLLMAQAHPVRQFGNAPALAREDVNALLEEARTRLRYRYQSMPKPNFFPEPILQLADWQEHAIMVDLATSRLYLFRNHKDQGGDPVLLADYYISSGKNGVGKSRRGDGKTPIGLYQITDHLLGDKLPNFYGAGALPINYPNEWDRLHHKTGYGIWLHGSPIDTYSRPPKASDGCVALTNTDFRILQAMVAIGTPVIITEALQWLPEPKWREQRTHFQNQLNQWQQDWNHRKLDRLLPYYSRAFKNSRHNRQSWSKELAFLLAERSGQEVSPISPSILGYPETDGLPMIVVSFPPAEVAGKERRIRKQYWQRERDRKWRIVFEDFMAG